jgi:hypothetical protein
MATLPLVLNNQADTRSAGGVALRAGTQRALDINECTVSVATQQHWFRPQFKTTGKAKTSIATRARPQTHAAKRKPSQQPALVSTGGPRRGGASDRPAGSAQGTEAVAGRAIRPSPETVNGPDPAGAPLAAGLPAAVGTATSIGAAAAGNQDDARAVSREREQRFGLGRRQAQVSAKAP